MAAVIAVVAVLVIVFMPYIKRAYDRITFLKRIKNMCHIKMYRLKITDYFISCFGNVSNQYDFTVDTGKVFYEVKLWDEFYKHSNLVFSSDENVLRRKKVQSAFGKDGRKSHRVIEKNLGKINFQKIAVPKGRKEVKILIFKSNGTKVFFENGNEIKRLSSGDDLYGMTLKICSKYPLKKENNHKMQ